MLKAYGRKGRCYLTKEGVLKVVLWAKELNHPPTYYLFRVSFLLYTSREAT